MATSKAERAQFRRVALTTPHGLIASGFGSGLSPVAPGTAGSLAALVVYLPLAQQPLAVQAGIIAAVFLIGTWAADRMSRELGVHDHGGIVIDEFVGLWLALLACPPTWWALALGFGLFRLFDILKPPPIGWLDRRVEGGLGIMLDDVIAGVYAWLVLHALLRWWGN